MTQIGNSGAETLLLCAIAKDEGQYVKEWVDFHLNLGVSKIIIYDNDSSVPLSPTDFAGVEQLVDIVSWRTELGVAPQVPAYNDCLIQHSDQFHWILFLDLDEFLNLKVDDNVPDFLKRFSEAEGVAINWRMFGSAGLDKNDCNPVLHRFLQASSDVFAPNAHVKTMFRPNSVSGVGVHTPEFLEGARLVNPSNLAIAHGSLQWNIDLNIAQINHYFVKSKEEFARKRLRGRADVEAGNEQKYRIEAEFDMYNTNDVKELSILRHLQRLEIKNASL